MTEIAERKEDHRLGTTNRWDPPKEEWAAEFDWTRHRGKTAYPVPEAWVLSTVEGDGVIWTLFSYAGKGQPHWNDAVEALGNPKSVEPDAYATLGAEWPKQADIEEDDPYHELKIDSEIVLVLKDEGDGWWHAVAAALARYATGGDYLSVLEDLWLEHLKARPFDESDDKLNTGTNQTLGDFTEANDD